jgi:hypothetical protein
MSAESQIIDPVRLQKELEIEKQVARELPVARDAELLAREVFVGLVVRSGDPADRRNVEAAWRASKTAVEVYLAKAGEIQALHDLHKQRKIRARTMLS